MLEHYHWALQNGISLKGWTDTNYVIVLCYIKLYNQTISAPSTQMKYMTLMVNPIWHYLFLVVDDIINTEILCCSICTISIQQPTQYLVLLVVRLQIDVHDLDNQVFNLF